MNRSILCSIAGAVLCLQGASSLAAEPSVTVAESGVASPVLGLAEIEARLSAQGIVVKEMEIRDLIVKIEGYDADGAEIELVVDRRTGETLSREIDD